MNRLSSCECTRCILYEVVMPLYLSQHTLACLTRQGAKLLQRMQSGAEARAERVLLNMFEGKMFAPIEKEFSADAGE